MATETLRPNAAGDENAISTQFPADSFPATDHWNKVDESSPDENTTYVSSSSTVGLRDLYNLPAHSVGSGTINSITIYFRTATDWPGYTVAAKPSQKSGVTVTNGTEQTHTSTTYSTKSQTYSVNPTTSAAYTWAEIDALQIGLVLRTNNAGHPARCTQVYVEVDYAPQITKTAIALARALRQYTKTITAKARALRQYTKTATAKAFTIWQFTKTGTTLARIFKTLTKTATTLARVICIHFVKANMAKAKMLVRSTKSSSSLGRIQGIVFYEIRGRAGHKYRAKSGF